MSMRSKRQGDRRGLGGATGKEACNFLAINIILQHHDFVACYLISCMLISFVCIVCAFVSFYEQASDMCKMHTLKFNMID